MKGFGGEKRNEILQMILLDSELSYWMKPTSDIDVLK
jgi:Fe-S cluster assembly ATPase SufC